MDKFRQVAIVGGTHGNEFTGVYLIKKFEHFPGLVKRPSFETLLMLANPQAFQANTRYIEKDLNRCFSLEDLNNPLGSSYEQNRAKFINQVLGPKGNPQVDFIVDIHSTTANMDLSLILLDDNLFNRTLAAYLSSIEPRVKIYSWIDPEKESSFLSSICDKGLGLEVGPIPQGILQASLFQKTEELIHAILDYLDKYNQGEMPQFSHSVTIYKHLKVVDYPKNEDGEIQGMIHPQLQGKDYEELKPGDPLFLTFDGKTIYYEEDSSVYPVFINEAAYYEKGIAMCFTTKEQVSA